MQGTRICADLVQFASYRWNGDSRFTLTLQIHTKLTCQLLRSITIWRRSNWGIFGAKLFRYGISSTYMQGYVPWSLEAV